MRLAASLITAIIPVLANPQQHPPHLAVGYFQPAATDAAILLDFL
jgi:hypothetical protein